jgi:ABC-2 type transport system ATP-binding protein
MNTIIELKNITKHYGNFRAIENVTLSINEGQIYSLLGANGAGKSTIIKLITNLNKLTDKDHGEIIISDNGKRITPREIMGKIGYVPEDRVLIEDLTGEEFVDFIARLNKCELKSIKKQKDYLFELFEMAKRKKGMIRFYSNGMKKKILIISALVHSPKILIVDEPFASLDPESIFILKGLFRELANRGCAVVISSHNLRVAEDISDKILLINRGKVLFEGTKKSLFNKIDVLSLEEGYIKLLSSYADIKEINDHIHNIPYTTQNLV